MRREPPGVVEAQEATDIESGEASAFAPSTSGEPRPPATPAEPGKMSTRPLRLVSARLDRALSPVFDRAHAASQSVADETMGTAAGADQPAPTHISNTFNVKVALGGGGGALDARQLEESLGDWLRMAARRQGLMP